jgi:serine protease Do
MSMSNHRLAGALILLFALCGPSVHAQPAPAAAPAQRPAAPNTVTLPSFASLVKEEGPAVVNISTTRTVTDADIAQAAPGSGDPLEEFFRRFMQPPSQGERVARGLGSGFIINQDGYILTNAHVVTDSDEVTVKLTDKREFKAKVLGADSYTDIALVKIEARGLPVVRIGNPNTLEPGEWVAAIGAPFGFENSVTAGIVSAKGRVLPDESYVPFIQTDVAVNPGNSGGPLFNMRGEVVGVNSQIYSRTGGYMGVAFAIPIDIAMNIADQIRTTGKVTRSKVGVQVQELTRDLASSFGLKEPRGALVAGVEKGGPADKAGLRPGDVLLGVNNQPIEGSADLARLIAGIKPGSTVTLQVWRKGQQVPVKLTTEELRAPSATPQGSAESSSSAGRTGLAVSDIPAAQRASLGIDAGVLVRRATGVAARAGLAPGDIIMRVNDTPVKSVAQLNSLLAAHVGKTAALLVLREGETVFVPLPVPAGGGK